MRRNLQPPADSEGVDCQPNPLRVKGLAERATGFELATSSSGNPPERVRMRNNAAVTSFQN